MKKYDNLSNYIVDLLLEDKYERKYNAMFEQIFEKIEKYENMFSTMKDNKLMCLNESTKWKDRKIEKYENMFSTMKDNKSMYLNKPSKILHKIFVQRKKSLHELSAKY